ncbi:MAG: hypothetical protein PHH58_13445 [Rhodoferax sp.]|nr:hypothetical protein [Rhodoferax sp.]
MKRQSDSYAPWTVDPLVEALNRLRDAWTRASLELRDLQFELDTTRRQAANEFVHDIMEKIK